MTLPAGAITSNPLIVQILPGLNITAVAAALGGRVVDSIPGANTYLLNVPIVPSGLLASILGIVGMELNQGLAQPPIPVPLIIAVPPNTPPDWYKSQPGMTVIHSGDALAYSRGRGIVIADLNSQVDVAHPALVGHLTTGFDFVTSQPDGATELNQSSSSFMDQSSSSFMDQSSSSFMDAFDGTPVDTVISSILVGSNPAYSHGTLCAGVIAAIAPDSMIMPLRVFDDNGSADIFTISKAIRYAADQGAQVINMSFGTLENSSTLKSAVSYAQSKGVTLVASAGNNDTSSPQYPAAFPGVLTTAATDNYDNKASFSNYGSYVFIDAPGVNIFSTYPGGYYSVVSGTSFSAPAVAGTAALIRSLHATGVTNYVVAGAVNVDAKNPNYKKQLGYGRIDVLQAITSN
jgi:subtilisin family serine protease